MPQPIVFVVPPNSTLPTGGNLYNQFLIDALREMGCEASVFEPSALTPESLEEAETAVLDSALLEQVPQILAKLPHQAFKVLLVHHLPSFEPGVSRSSASSSEAKLLSGIQCLIATSEFSRQGLHDRFGTARPVGVVPPALAVEPRPGSSRDSRPSGTPLRALAVANFLPLKGILPLLEALEHELDPDDAFRLEILGRQDLDPRYAARCRDRVSRSALLQQIVTLSDAVPPADMVAHYENSSLFLSASQAETFGMALQEARAFGLPILALDAGNVSQHVSSDGTGRLFASVDGLARTCLELARTPDRLEALCDSAYRHRRAPDWDWPRAAARFLEFLSTHAAVDVSD